MRLFLSVLVLITGLCTNVWGFDSTFQRSTPFVALSSDSDALVVSEANNVLVDASGGTVTLGGFSGGSIGQTVQIVNTDDTNPLIIEHNESSGTEKFILPDGTDVSLTSTGGLVVRYDGSFWYGVASTIAAPTTLDDAYNASAGAALVTVDAGDVTWAPTGDYSFIVDMAAATNTADGFSVVNGTDRFGLIRKGVNLTDLDADLQNIDISASVNMTLAAAGVFTLTTPTIGDYTNATHDHTGPPGGGTVAHSVTTGQTTDDHHAQSHTIVSHDTTATGANLNTLTGAADTTLHYHDADRARANHTGTQTASTISDFDTEVSNNTDVAANTTHRSSNGSDHTFIDQSVVIASSPSFGTPTITSFASAAHDHADAAGGGLVPSSSISLATISTPTYDNVDDWWNITQSAGIASGAVITDGGSGTINVSDVKGVVKSTDSEIGTNFWFDLAGLTGQVLTDNDTNWIAVDYNGGVPQWIIGLSNTANGHTIFNAGKVYREGTFVDIIDSGLNIYDASKRLQQHQIEEAGLHFVSGAIVGETGTRNISITAGIMYAGINRIITDAIDTSAADDFEYYYYNGAAWVESSQTQIDNLQWNNIASGLVTLTNNRYGVHWVYKGTNSTTYVIYGQGDYLLSQAQSAQPPASLPDHVEGFGVLRAKVIVQKSDAAFTEIESVTDTQFQSSTPSNHNDLANIQGGTADDYYHLTGTLAGYINQDVQSTASPSFVGETLSGDMTFTGGGSVLTTANGNIDLIPNGTGINTTGGGTGSHSLDAPGDLYVSGEFEVDGATYLDANVNLRDNVPLRFGNGPDSSIVWRTVQTNDAAIWGLGSTSKTVIFCDNPNMDYNFAHSNQSDPTVIIHSTNQSTDEYWGQTHNQTDAKEIIGKGSKVTEHITPVELADDGFFDLPDASSGFGTFRVVDDDEFAIVIWDSDGSVVVVTSNGSVVATDTDTNLCFFDNGTATRVRNRLGFTKKIIFDYGYTTP